ncbi:MAG: hypothetical protein VYC11_04365 [Candidatus Thermoplasmatota archaeon]|nr:hypothetical protein [Euryarchaeota archaeon]MEC9090586.1 hypothetical protein [Candidatus Thermoplasmatota archaeon]
MTDWKTLMNEAMQLESNDAIAAFAKFKQCIDAATSATQTSLNTNPNVGIAMESVYGALAAYAQQVMMELRAEDPGAGGVDHAFRAGQAYGVSCVLNHIFDELRDPNADSLQALDAFSDQMHDEILQTCEQVDLAMILLDAKGNYYEN